MCTRLTILIRLDGVANYKETMELALLSVMLLTQTKDVVTNAEVQRSAYTAIASFASRLGTRKPERNLKLRTTGYGGYILLHAKVGIFDDYALSADGKIVLCYTNVDLEVRALRREGTRFTNLKRTFGGGQRRRSCVSGSSLLIGP